MDEYMELGSRRLPPHCYGVADDAFKALMDNKTSQSCIVSGESGAGKTEATRVFLAYVTEKSKRSVAGNAKNSAFAHEMQQKILESNPLMEAFGNAKTIRNDNSSRFGKWIELQLDLTNGAIVGGSIRSYLLEKSRIVFQAENERNYHVFYQICAASQIDPVLEKYNIGEADQYHYLNQSEKPCTTVASIDDFSDWNETKNAMDQIGITEAERADIINVLQLVLTIGNTNFLGDEISAIDSKSVVEDAAKYMGVSYADLERALIKIDRSTNQDPNLVGNHSVLQACDARDAFAKHIYALLFDWIIHKINVALGKVKQSPNISTIGVLDIFGFEFFEKNSFEQLCINFCNERLQGHFNDHIFKLEQEQYAKEGIDVTKIEFVDNENVIQTIDSKGGVLQIIAEELKINNGTDKTLLAKLKAKADSVKNDPRMCVITYPDNKEVKRNSSLDDVFRISHYAGTVGYDVNKFLEKNRDTVPKLLQKLGEKSGNKFISALFKEGADTKKKALGLRFSDQLNELMTDLNKTQPHYIRCVKPNTDKEASNFMAPMVLDQLRYAGLLEVCRIRQMGYPIQRIHSEFFVRYRHILKGAYKDHNTLIKALKEANLLTDGKFQIGSTKVFLKTDQSDMLEEKRAMSLSQFVVKIQRVARGFIVRVVSKKFGKIRQDLRNAIKSRDKVKLRAAMLNFGEMPYGGKHLIEYKEGHDLMARIEDEERIAKYLKDVMESRDVNQIEAALKQAAEKKLDKTPEAVAAMKLLDQIRKEDACRKKLREAIDAADEAKIKNAMAEAKSLKIEDVVEMKDAATLLNKFEKERVCKANLQTAIKKQDIANIKKYMNEMADMGKADDPLVHQGEALVHEKAKQAAEIQRRKENLLFSLERAIKDRNLAALEGLEEQVIELGIEGDIVLQARKIRGALSSEKQVCAKLNAESTSAMAKGQARAGLVPQDLDAFKIAIKEAEAILPADDFQLLSAQEDLQNLEEQLRVQKDLSESLVKYGDMKSKIHNEKTKEGKDKLYGDLLSLLKEANGKAQDSGLNTNSAIEIKEKLNQLQLDIESRNQKEREEERQANLAKLVEATTYDLEVDAAKRLQFTSNLSDKHRNLLQESANATRYSLNKYYRIRSDDDFVEKISNESKEYAAKTKLISRGKPITRSICRLSDEQNVVAIKINRAILQYCGDLATTFPATLAQFVLVRGLEDASMTDEIYIQIIKHITDNEKPDSADKAWLLMCMATKIFPPTDEFAPYLLHFLINNKAKLGLIGNYARLCIVQLDATIELGPTWFKPNLEEITSYRKRPPILATIYTLENKQIDYPVTPDMRVAQVLDLVRRKENIEDDYEHPTWGIYVIAEEEEEVQTPKERLIKFYQFYNPAKLAHVDLFLDHWKNNTEELFEKLVFKYGPEPTEDDKTKKKGVLSLPITAAMSAVKFFGFTNQRDQPPAPEVSWPVPWWTHLGDVYFRMSKQKKVPRFVFKRRLITKNEKVDKWLYLQAVDDIRKGYLPLKDPAKVAQMAALALQYDHGHDVIQHNLGVPNLLALGLQKYIPEEMLKEKNAEEYAQIVLKIFQEKQLPKNQDDIMLTYVGLCRQMPVYGMNFFYARHAASEKNYVISVDVDGIHVLEEDRSAVKRSFSFNTIKKFGATAEYFWMNIDEKQDYKGGLLNFLNTNQGINVLLYTLQSWEMYDCVYDATHIDVEE